MDTGSLSRHEQEQLALIKRLPTEEILTEELLTEYITSKERLKHYIGFEISGMVHLGSGLISMGKIADLQKAGVETSVFLADMHTLINKKLSEDIDAIRHTAKNYFSEALKISLKCAGGDAESTKFIMGSELYEKMGEQYFENVLNVASAITMARAKRSITILGRKEGENISLSQLIYVPMQVADIYSMGVNIAHAGMDQRKAHVVAIESSGLFGYKPVALHHHLLMGMHMTEEQRSRLIKARDSGSRAEMENELIDIKMSKSKPGSAIFIHDSEDEIRKKVSGAYCPMGATEVNPIMDLARYVIWPYLMRKGLTFDIQNKKTGSTVSYSSIGELESAFANSLIHPADLKEAVSNYIIEILEPARSFFIDGNGAKYLEEMQKVKTTR
ncbi:MAG: tyrosine--tRNA ligase [Candidatus Marsarchaeota archaeon]|jgi:tyrosyl-tRNA synthetase|nr:tyrosine--tRNA ligase [Candidatus Marsarchaeota archaeon]MCL5418376.1 tyrosine--tRNA ligase [Candidatus Marsarchaeota archaeon]